MSEPKRYQYIDVDGVIIEHFKGEYVLHSDYEKLKAEKRSLKTKLGRLLGGEQEWVLVEPSEYKRLKDETKRLRRAGDLMLKHACANVNYPCYATMEKNWLYAKLPPTDQTK